MKVSIIPYSFYCILDKKTGNQGSLFNEFTNNKDIIALLNGFIETLPTTEECKTEKKMEIINNKLVSLNNFFELKEDNNFIKCFLDIKVSSLDLNFDGKSIVDTKEKTIAPKDLAISQNIGDGFFIGMYIEKNYRVIKNEKRRIGKFFITKKGTESAKGIAEHFLRTIFSSNNLISQPITDKNDVYRLQTALKEVELIGNIRASALSSLPGVDEFLGELDVSIKIKKSEKPNGLNRILGWGQEEKFNKDNLFRFGIKKIKGTIIDSYGEERKEDLIKEDNTVEAIEKALSYSIRMDENNFTLNNFKHICESFLVNSNNLENV